MIETNDQPSVMEIASNDRLLSKFKTANDRLAKIEKGLNEYLELKRSYFPRYEKKEFIHSSSMLFVKIDN